MQKAIVVFALLAVCALGSIHINTEEVKSLWSSWKSYHGKAYSTAEEAARFAIFMDNYRRVIEFNAVHEKVKLGLNNFADITPTEFKTIYASGHKKKNTQAVVEEEEFVKVGDLPATVDWRSKGAINKVKNQAHCGSCWTFAATGALEAFYFINHGALLSFSEQQIVDCDKNNGNAGCDGGDEIEALDYAAQNGIELEATYPYTGVDGTCNYRKILAIKANGGHRNITKKSTDALKTALVDQPVSVAIEADQDVFHLYTSGVVGEGCGDDLDHAVLAVGYTTLGDEEVFIIKNSWTASWGQGGYVYVSTKSDYNNGGGACGILLEAAVPTN